MSQLTRKEVLAKLQKHYQRAGAEYKTKLITQAVEHKGFSYIDAMSPCTTFNNTQESWKDAVTDVAPDHDPTDRVKAFDLALRGGFSLGILYQLALGQRRPLREVLPGVGSSLAAWLLLSMAFSYYVENMARYAQLYGSIATIVVVLLWLYMSGQVLILGAELSASLIHRKKHAAPSSGGEEEA